MPIAAALTGWWDLDTAFGTVSADRYLVNDYVPRRRPAESTANFCIAANSSVTPGQFGKFRTSRIALWQNVCKTQAQIETLATDITYGNAAYSNATAMWKCREAGGTANFTMVDEVGGVSNLTAVAAVGAPINSVAGPFGAANDALQFNSGTVSNRAFTSTLTNIKYTAGTDYTMGGFVYIDAHPTVGAPGDNQGVFFGQHKLDANNIGAVLYEYAWNVSGNRYLNCDFGNGPTDNNLAGNAVNDGAVALVTGQWYYIAMTYKASTGVFTVYKIPVGGATTLNAFTCTAAVDSGTGKISGARKMVAVPQWSQGVSGYDVAKTSPLEIASPTAALIAHLTKFSVTVFHKPDATSGTQTVWSDGFNGTTNAMRGAIQLSGGIYYGLVGNGAGSFQYASRASGAAGTWHHLVLTFDAAGDNKPHLWVNGVEGTINGTAGFTVARPAGATFRLGCTQNDAQQSAGLYDLHGFADNYQADATDVATLYAAGAGWQPPVGYTLTAASGSFTLTGQAAGLLVARRLTAAAGSFTLTGQSANLLTARRLSAASGSFTLTGQPANFLKGRTLTADAGTFALSGQPAALRRTLLLPAGIGTFTLTGAPAALLAGRRLVATAGTYALAGQPATLTITSSGPLPVLRVAVTCTLRRRGSATCTRR